MDARYFVVTPGRSQLVELARFVEEGSLSLDVDAVFSLADARSAFAHSMTRGRRGKVVIRVLE